MLVLQNYMIQTANMEGKFTDIHRSCFIVCRRLAVCNMTVLTFSLDNSNRLFQRRVIDCKAHAFHITSNLSGVVSGRHFLGSP